MKKKSLRNKLVNEFFTYEFNWNQEEFFKYYCNEKHFKKTYTKILKKNPNYFYSSIADQIKETIYYSNLNDSTNINRLHKMIDLLIKIGKFYQKEKIKMNRI